VHFLEFPLEIEGQAEVVIERSAEFLAARKDQVHFGYDQRPLADGFDVEVGLAGKRVASLFEKVKTVGHRLQIFGIDSGTDADGRIPSPTRWMSTSTYLRRKVDSGYHRPLIRTVRGTGYQIGTNGCLSKNAVA
jgi:hypothetical protein